MTTMPTFAVQIRTKTINRLGLKENVVAQIKLANSIVSFRDSSYKDALKTIFALVYGSEIREDLLQRFGFTSSPDMTEKYIILNDEQIVQLGKELKFQYKLSRPNFLEVEDNPGYQEELDGLKKAMSNHPILLYRIVELCEKCHESHDIVAPCVELLMSKNADSQKNGLRKLGNNAQYQELLLPYAEKIGVLLQAMYNWHEEQQLILEAQEELNKFPSPFSQLSDMLRKKQEEDELNEAISASTNTPCIEQPTDSADKNCDNFKKYSLSDELSKFIKNKSHIVRNLPRDDEFWSCLRRLRDLGINLNDLVDNELYLWPILNAHDHLDEAIAELYDAELTFEEARKNFKMGEFTTIEVLFHAGKAREQAKQEYNSAFDAFLAHCRAYEKAVRN